MKTKNEQKNKFEFATPKGNWVFERSSGYAGERCSSCGTWVHCHDEKICFCDEQLAIKIKATMVTCNGVIKGYRALQDMEGSGSKYLPHYTEKAKRVTVTTIRISELWKALNSIGINVIGDESIIKVAEKFKDEICSIKGSKICWDEDTNRGFFKILKK